MTILSFLSLNNEEVTEQGRSIKSSVNIASSPVDLDSGISKRYLKTNKRVLTVAWEWMPSLQSHTIDNRKSRDFVKNLIFIKNKTLVKVKLDHNEAAEEFYAYITDYSEDLIRRAVPDACDYYNVTVSLEEA